MAVITTQKIVYNYGDTIKLKPIFDVHLGNKYCDEKALKRYIDDRDENTYFMTGGDLFDSIIVKDQKRYEKHSDDTEGDDILDEQIDRGEAYLRPLADEGRLIGCGDGNHEKTILKHCSTNMTKRLCRRLKVPYLGYSGMIRLSMRDKHNHGRSVCVYYHHGFGGGSRTQGADLTKYSKHAATIDADIFLYGHVHRKQTDEIPRLAAIGGKWKAKDKHIAICGTYLKTLSNTTDSTYSEVAGYPPTAIGGVEISIKPQEYWVELKVDK